MHNLYLAHFSKMRPNRKRIVAIAVFGVTLVLGITAIILAWRLQQQQKITEEEAAAASEEVTNADMMKTQQQRTEFYQKWQKFQSEEHSSAEYITYALGEGARYKCDQAIMTVGTETLYGCDLNAVFVIHEFPTYIQLEEITAQNSYLNKVLDELITQSGILQKGEELGLVTLDATIFNSPTKDTTSRFEVLKSLREQIGDKLVKTIDFEAVGIYFFNQKEIDRDITIEEAKQAAKTKMDFLYNLLKDKKITMMEAGDMIKADKICFNENGIETCEQSGISNAQLDTLYKQNAYYKVIGHEFDIQAFSDPTYEEELRSLGDGQISTVRLFRDFKFTDEEYQRMLEGEDISVERTDSAYFIFKNIKVTEALTADISSGSVEGVETNIFEEYRSQTN